MLKNPVNYSGHFLGTYKKWAPLRQAAAVTTVAWKGGTSQSRPLRHHWVVVPLFLAGVTREQADTSIVCVETSTYLLKSITEK